MSGDKKSQPSQQPPAQRPVKINEEKGLRPPVSPPPPMPSVKPPKK